FLTTNFSLTYFMVAGEIENSGLSAHLIVHDCDGMSVLTAWAAGKFTGTKVAEFIKAAELPPGDEGRKIVIPGYASRISGDLQEGLPDFKVVVGPQEAADIPGYVKQVL
ncbi:MAG: acetyl-CoA decarbonylase/synthase complex subunit gamma, partial [Proteobacteria bacterium]|nr:acetyl-CoA decarbonylase/synthase complex subunit gamma [Pseudomonadota bacterium]